MRVELGCGKHPKEGFIHHDRVRHAPFVDVVWDLENLPWPWADDSIELLEATDVFEHLRLEVADWMFECWRVLKVGGVLSMRLPAWDNPYSYRDPTHRRVFHPESFHYFCPEAPGTVWHDFGHYYFQEYNRWWKLVRSTREAKDLRFLLQKVIYRPEKITAMGR